VYHSHASVTEDMVAITIRASRRSIPMAIKQERMISLINAAVEYRNAYISLYNAMIENSKRNNHNLDLHIARMAQTILELGEKYNAIMIVEAQTFARNFERNIHEKERLALRRRVMGVPVRRARPSIINEANSLITNTLSVHEQTTADKSLVVSEADYERINREIEAELAKDADYHDGVTGILPVDKGDDDDETDDDIE
jgi:hypothetical protein